jgi:hypothetical protein
MFLHLFNVLGKHLDTVPEPRILNEDPYPLNLTCGVRIADPGLNFMKDPCGYGLEFVGYCIYYIPSFPLLSRKHHFSEEKEEEEKGEAGASARAGSVRRAGQPLPQPQQDPRPGLRPSSPFS